MQIEVHPINGFIFLRVLFTFIYLQSLDVGQEHFVMNFTHSKVISHDIISEFDNPIVNNWIK